MLSKKIRTALGRFFARLGLNLSSLIIRLLPARYIYGFGRILSQIGYRFVKKQRKIALESLEIAFGGEKSGHEIEQIARQSFDYMSISVVELIFLMGKPKILRRRVSCSGKKNLDDSLAKGKGVILVSAHFGNFPLMMAKLALEGYKIAGIMRPMRDSSVEKIFLRQRDRMGIKTIYSQPRDTCVNSTIEALRNNELVFIPLDQNFGTGGIFVDFFGRKAATATGPIVLARRTKAALLPCFILRQKDDTHKIVFEPPLDLEEGKNPAETIAINIQKLTGVIESYIRRYPAEWSWVHRRWKSRIKGGV